MELDGPKEIRNGEELNVNSLQAYLTNYLGKHDQLSVRQFPSGFSNLTYLINYGGDEYVLRRPPFGSKIKSGHDMSREYRFLQSLYEPYSKVPKPILYCEDDEVVGAPFYLMERVPGVILRGNIPSSLRPSKTEMELISDATIKTLTELHQIDLEKHQLTHLGKPEGYIGRQIKGWSDRYKNAKTDEVVEMDEVSNWLSRNLPADNKPALIHNDFKYDNLILNPEDLSEIRAVLDWEMATIGDPLMDLGTTLGYWVEPNDPELLIKLSLSPTHWPGNPSRIEIADRYAAITGASLDNLVFYYVQGVFKIAVIVQQIYYRYKAGHTKDERFANLIHAVHAFGKLAVKAIETNKIS